MENEIPVIVISDDEEEEPTSREAESSVIIIPDDDVIDGFADSPACQPLETKHSLRHQNGDIDNPSTSFTSSQPICCSQTKKCNLDVTRFQSLKARIKIPKLDPDALNRLLSSPKKLDNGENPRSAVNPNRQVKIEDDMNHSHSSEQLGEEQDMSLFESCKRKFFESPKKETDSHNTNITSYKTASKCTPSPLKQSKLNRESFSPKGRQPGDLCLKQEQSTPYVTPLYCAVPLRCSECTSSVSRTFTENQLNSLQALKEEEFYKLVLDTVVTFMSQFRKPPSSLVFYLFHNILLSKKSNLGPQCLRVLQEIQVLHPAVPAEMLRQKVTWEYLSKVVDLSQCTQKCKPNSSHMRAGLAFNSFMALTFLVIVMEGEVQRKTFSLVKTSVYRLLHAFKQSSHIHDIVFWIGRSVQQHSNVSLSCGYSCCPVFILQRFLHLSLLVSEKPVDSATRIADDLVLVYLELQYLHHKTLFLRSFQSHLLRTKLIEVVINNICPSYTDQENRVYFSGGIRSFVTCMFQFSPPTSSTLSQDCFSQEPAKKGVCADSCEEFIMLLAYWIQSFLFTRRRTLQKNTSDLLPKLSLDDVDVLLKLDELVASFKVHLESLCFPLSSRSYQLLDLILSLKSCFAVKEL